MKIVPAGLDVYLITSLPSGHSYDDKLIVLFHRETGSAFQSAVSMLCLVGGIAGYEFPSLQPYRAPECKSYWPPEPGC